MRMGAAKAKEQPPQDSVAAELAALREKVDLLQKYGPLSDEELAEKKEAEERKARRVVEMAAQEERRKTEEERVRQETREIADRELGKRIVISLNRKPVTTLTPDGGIPCPGCGAPLPEATGALLALAAVILTVPNLRDLLLPVMNPGFGMPRLGAPAIYLGENCKGCGASIETLAQLIVA